MALPNINNHVEVDNWASMMNAVANQCGLVTSPVDWRAAAADRLTWVTIVGVDLGHGATNLTDPIQVRVPKGDEPTPLMVREKRFTRGRRVGSRDDLVATLSDWGLVPPRRRMPITV